MKAKKIIHSILDENAVTAKKLISEDLVVKLGQRLAEEYIRVAKETFNEADKDLANNYPPFDKVTRGDIIAAGRDEEQDGEVEGEEEEMEEEGEEEEGEEEEGEEESTPAMPMQRSMQKPMQMPGQTPSGFDVRMSYNG